MAENAAEAWSSGGSTRGHDSTALSRHVIAGAEHEAGQEGGGEQEAKSKGQLCGPYSKELRPLRIWRSSERRLVLLPGTPHWMQAWWVLRWPLVWSPIIWRRWKKLMGSSLHGAKRLREPALKKALVTSLGARAVRERRGRARRRIWWCWGRCSPFGSNFFGPPDGDCLFVDGGAGEEDEGLKGGPSPRWSVCRHYIGSSVRWEQQTCSRSTKDSSTSSSGSPRGHQCFGREVDAGRPHSSSSSSGSSERNPQCKSLGGTQVSSGTPQNGSLLLLVGSWNPGRLDSRKTSTCESESCPADLTIRSNSHRSWLVGVLIRAFFGAKPTICSSCRSLLTFSWRRRESFLPSPRWEVGGKSAFRTCETPKISWRSGVLWERRRKRWRRTDKERARAKVKAKAKAGADEPVNAWPPKLTVALKSLMLRFQVFELLLSMFLLWWIQLPASLESMVVGYLRFSRASLLQGPTLRCRVLTQVAYGRCHCRTLKPSGAVRVFLQIGGRGGPAFRCLCWIGFAWENLVLALLASAWDENWVVSNGDRCACLSTWVKMRIQFLR